MPASPRPRRPRAPAAAGRRAVAPARPAACRAARRHAASHAPRAGARQPGRPRWRSTGIAIASRARGPARRCCLAGSSARRFASSGHRMRQTAQRQRLRGWQRLRGRQRPARRRQVTQRRSWRAPPPHHRASAGETPACAAAPSPGRCIRPARGRARHAHARPCCTSVGPRQRAATTPVARRWPHPDRPHRARPAPLASPPSVAADRPAPPGCLRPKDRVRAARRRRRRAPRRRLRRAHRSPAPHGRDRPRRASGAHRLR